jgi:hypothetical protein
MQAEDQVTEDSLQVAFFLDQREALKGILVVLSNGDARKTMLLPERHRLAGFMLES